MCLYLNCKLLSGGLFFVTFSLPTVGFSRDYKSIPPTCSIQLLVWTAAGHESLARSAPQEAALTGFNVPPPRTPVPRVPCSRAATLGASYCAVGPAGWQHNPAFPRIRSNREVSSSRAISQARSRKSLCQAWIRLEINIWTLCLLPLENKQKIPNPHTILSSLPCECSLIKSLCSSL